MDLDLALHYGFLIYKNLGEWKNEAVYSKSSRGSKYSSTCLNIAWATTAAEGMCLHGAAAFNSTIRYQRDKQNLSLNEPAPLIF